MLTKTKPQVSGVLEDLSDYCPESQRYLIQSMVEALGDSGKDQFRIPAADTGHEVFFDNREVLSRFASMTKPAQEAFLKSVRIAMKEEQTETLHITIQWSKVNKRTIIITEANAAGALNIYLA